MCGSESEFHQARFHVPFFMTANRSDYLPCQVLSRQKSTHFWLAALDFLPRLEVHFSVTVIFVCFDRFQQSIHFIIERVDQTQILQTFDMIPHVYEKTRFQVVLQTRENLSVIDSEATFSPHHCFLN